MSVLKGDIINGAYSRMRISGITKQPTTREVSVALERLEDMMASWGAWNIDIGYNFEEIPDSGTPHGLARVHLAGVKSNLALKLLSDYGKDAPMSLATEAGAAFAQLLASASKQPMTQYPARMPIGSGNRQINNWQRFAPLSDTIEQDYSAYEMFTEDVKDFEENLASALRTDNTETITSFTVSAEDGVTIASSSLTSPVVSYRVQAGDTANSRVVVTIVATTSLGQRITKQIFFSIKGLNQ